jgi:hypothetical protein
MVLDRHFAQYRRLAKPLLVSFLAIGIYVEFEHLFCRNESINVALDR